MSEPCHRFEAELATRLDAEPDAHELACEDCREARAAYRAIAKGIAELPAEEPPAGWERKLLERIPGSVQPLPAPRPSRSRWGAILLAAAVAAALLFFLLRRPPQDERIALAQDVRHAGSDHRSGGAALGDELTARGPRDPKGAELRIYRDGALVVRCPSDARCTGDARSVQVSLKLEARGTYRVLSITGGGALPEPTGSLDADAAAATASGAGVEMGAPITVD